MQGSVLYWTAINCIHVLAELVNCSLLEILCPGVTSPIEPDRQVRSSEGLLSALGGPRLLLL